MPTINWKRCSNEKAIWSSARTSNPHPIWFGERRSDDTSRSMFNWMSIEWTQATDNAQRIKCSDGNVPPPPSKSTSNKYYYYLNFPLIQTLSTINYSSLQFLLFVEWKNIPSIRFKFSAFISSTSSGDPCEYFFYSLSALRSNSAFISNN